MPAVLLFHHSLGQTEGFHAFADQLRQAGHTVAVEGDPGAPG
jgi:esterase/lipase